MKFCGKSDIGMQRKINQDSFKCLSLWGGEATLLIVCDGMGGAAGDGRSQGGRNCQ